MNPGRGGGFGFTANRPARVTLFEEDPLGDHADPTRSQRVTGLGRSW